jgi:type III restriction enzyme
MKIKFESLKYQKDAILSISDVFCGAVFLKPQDDYSNPILNLHASRDSILENIKTVRDRNKVTSGNVQVQNDITIDILMETGTGKTFTFLESIFRLNREYNISKFVILVPSNAIRQGTIKNIQLTKDFFKNEYEKTLNIYDYNEKTVGNYINESNGNIAILISTY